VKINNTVKVNTMDIAEHQELKILHNKNRIKQIKKVVTGRRIRWLYYNESFWSSKVGPSSYNNQPWRFIYAKRNTSHWDKLFNLLAELNKVCTKNAAVLVVVTARKNFEHNEKYSITHQFDAGAAWENLALEASSRGLAVHAMQGFDYERARADLQIPDNFDVMAMIAMGRRGPRITSLHNSRKENNQTIENL
jgi:nitroreductase